MLVMEVRVNFDITAILKQKNPLQEPTFNDCNQAQNTDSKGKKKGTMTFPIPLYV